MQTLASLTRVTKKGLVSNWHFVKTQDGFFAFGGCHKPLIKRFDTIEQLRALYANYLGYGYKPVTDELQLEFALS